VGYFELTQDYGADAGCSEHYYTTIIVLNSLIPLGVG
jgi:hypothetical protein